ncbi:MAG TPA: pilus assembly protein N-terminal domain-containing protein [Candidatus Elarobacter sp.]
MHQFLRPLVAFSAIAVVAAPLAARADVAIPLTVRTGQSQILATPQLSRVAIGDGKIAGVMPVGNSEIVVSGRSAGRTTLLVWTGRGRRTYDLTVTEQNLESLREMVQGAINDPSVHVDQFDRSLLVGGSVDNGERLVHVGEVLSRFDSVATAEKFSIVNAVTVARPLGPLQTDLALSPDTAGVRVDRDVKGNLIVSGQVPDRVTAEHVLARVRTLAGPYLAIDGKVVDRIETATVSQIDVKVYVLEVDETALRQLGVNLQSATFHPDGTYTLGSPQFPAVENPVGLGKALTIGAFFRSITLAPTLNLIVNSGHARVLSSPDLVTMPGRQADFLVGGQIPIPYASGPQQIAIQYKDFGVKLQVTPTILGSGGVETVITPEVSDLDFADGVSLNGFTVPALKTSRLSTDVVTKSGESIVMGGLMRRVEQRSIDKIPLLGDLPILGKLFRSTRYQSQQTDVVFVMTPQILTR